VVLERPREEPRSCLDLNPGHRRLRQHYRAVAGGNATPSPRSRGCAATSTDKRREYERISASAAPSSTTSARALEHGAVAEQRPLFPSTWRADRTEQRSTRIARSTRSRRNRRQSATNALASFIERCISLSARNPP